MTTISPRKLAVTICILFVRHCLIKTFIKFYHVDSEMKKQLNETIAIVQDLKTKLNGKILDVKGIRY